MSSEAPPLRHPRLARALGWPLRRVLDPRVRWVAELTTELVDERVRQRLAAPGPGVPEIAALVREVRELVIEVQNHGRAVENRVDANERRLLALLGHLHVRLDGDPDALDGLGDDVAAFLNRTVGPDGYAAQAGLWFNPPVPVEYLAGGVRPLLVNERIVEQPLVFRALAELEPGSRVLDVGGSESTIALSLACSGHRVTVVDPRGYPLEHPRLRSLEVALEDLEPPETGFDAAVVVSSVEHFGLGHYHPDGLGRSPSEPPSPQPGDHGARADLAALAALRRHVRPGGLLVLTVPMSSQPGVDDFQRTYDAAGVRALLEGWTVTELGACWRQDGLTWLAGDIDDPSGDRGVALAVALNRPPDAV